MKINKVIYICNSIPEFAHKTTAQEIHNRIKGKDYDFIIINENDKPAGFLIAYKLNKKTYYNWLMGVLPVFRRKGYGRKLIEQFESFARERGYTSVQVKTMDKFKEMQHLLAGLKYEKIGHDDKGKIILRKNSDFG